jgi:transposase
VKIFVSTLVLRLSQAMGLRSQAFSDARFYSEAKKLKAKIIAVAESPARHLGIRRIQDIFRGNASRMYHWAEDRRIPADNNLAERDLGPTVIARKVSFGSQSDTGAHTRGVLMSVLCTLKKRGTDVDVHFKAALGKLAENIHQGPFPVLFPRPDPQPKSRKTVPSPKNSETSGDQRRRRR